MKNVKAFLFIFLIASSVLCLNAQDSLQKRNIYIGVTFSSASYKAFFSNRPTYLPEIKQRFPYRFGIDVKIRLTKQLSFTSGLLFDATHFVYEIKNTYSPSSNPATNLIIYKTINKSYNMGLPLRLDVRFMDANISPFATAGFFPSYYVGSNYKLIYTYEDGHEEHDGYNNLFNPSYRSIRLNYQVGAGIDISLNRFKLQVYPLYEFGFLTRFSPRYYYHRIGGAVSLCYGF